jgi:RimJ/RimL family protein N-acetyltransferase
MPLPALETRRLRLSAFREADIEELHHLWSDREVRRYLWNDRMVSLELAAETVQASLISAGVEGFGMWTVAEKGTGTLVGFCGFRRIRDASEVELLYGLWPRFWGQGLATEASGVAIDWLFATLSLDRVVAGADPGNDASFRVMRRLGMTPLEEGIPAVPHARYYELRRTAWRPDGGTRAATLGDARAEQSS